jgi:RimJ/RimL family protein N-acetyltransferase
MIEPLLRLCRDAAGGRFPPADGRVELLPPPSGPAAAAIVAMTAHHLVAADVNRTWLETTLDGSLAAPMSARFIVALEQELDLHADSVDVLLGARGIGGRSSLREVGNVVHPRVERAMRSRSDVRVYAGNDATIVLGRGAGGRLEIAIEVEASQRRRGVARETLRDALRLVDAAETLFAQIAPGNAAALRAALAAGFTPIGAEVLLFPHLVSD